MEKQRNLFLYFPKDDITKLIIKQAVNQLNNSASTTVESLRTLMNETASKLPEYPCCYGDERGWCFAWSSIDG